MTKPFIDYVPDKVIIEELKLCHAYNKALRRGVPKRERPRLPRPTKQKTSKLLLGVVLHSTNYILLGLSEMIGFLKGQEWLARKRITTDEFSSEPMSCGIHNAYTKYGIACLAQGNVTLAIQSLIYSIKIHPCPHSTLYGLSYVLRSKLLTYTEAEEAIQLFDVVARRFSEREWHSQQEKG
ncbi:hypothetical protein ACFL2P_00215 [Candidatus Moduliflexota bacterium]